MPDYAIAAGVIIAKDKSAMLDTLFKPVDGRTADGYIERVQAGKRNRGIKLWVNNETYVLNFDGVFCFATKLPDGRTWYSYGGNLNARLTCSGRHELACAIRELAAEHYN